MVPPPNVEGDDPPPKAEPVPPPNDPKADFAPPPNADCCGDACCASCPNAEDLAANAEKPPLVVPEPPKAEPDDDPLANGDLLALANGDPPKALPVLLPPPKADWLPNEGPLPNAGRPPKADPPKVEVVDDAAAAAGCCCAGLAVDVNQELDADGWRFARLRPPNGLFCAPPCGTAEPSPPPMKLKEAAVAAVVSSSIPSS